MDRGKEEREVERVLEGAEGEREATDFCSTLIPQTTYVGCMHENAPCMHTQMSHTHTQTHSLHLCLSIPHIL